MVLKVGDEFKVGFSLTKKVKTHSQSSKIIEREILNVCGSFIPIFFCLASDYDKKT